MDDNNPTATYKSPGPAPPDRSSARGDADAPSTCMVLPSERYQAFLENIEEGVYEVDIHGNYLYFNNALCRIFGYPRDEILFRNFSKFMDEENARKTRAAFNRIYTTGKGFSDLIWQIKTKTSETRIIELSANLITNKRGEKIGFRGIARDITEVNRIRRNNEALLRISLGLPNYPHLEDLLDYVSIEIKRLINVEGALVILLDEEKNEFFFKAAAHDDSAAERRVKEIRFSAERGVAGEVIRTGKPIIVPDTSKNADFYSVVDVQAGFQTRMMLDVPLRSKDRIVGVLCAMNKKSGAFDQTDVALLNMIAGTVALSIENARFSEEVREAYREVSSLNRAKDKVINHLSHELKTPVSILRATLNILGKRLGRLPGDKWQSTIDRAQRNLERLLELQYQVEDIIREKDYAAHRLMSWLLDACADELEALVAETVGEAPVVEQIRERINEIFGPVESPPEEIDLGRFVSETLHGIRPLFSHRRIELIPVFRPAPKIWMPADPLKKVVVGLVRNAVENTPDEGRIEVSVNGRGTGAELLVRDYGVGITPENQPRIFEGFFTTQDTMDYSSKRPYDFNAGGKGADLLRMKIFSERYHFRMHMASSRCPHIPTDKDICPGRISRCGYCRMIGDCHASGGTTFRVFFPSAIRDHGPIEEETTHG